MSDKIDDFLSKRTEFLTLLDQDIIKNESLSVDYMNNIESLEKSKQNIRELSKRPEHVALIPMCKRLYVQGTIVHTGEYLIEKQAYPHSYSVLKTLDETVKGIDTRIDEQKKLFEKAEMAAKQLNDRKNLLLGDKNGDFIVEGEYLEDEEDRREVAAMPEEIRSEKGVAVKVGSYFEILEYEEGS